jgi:plasminogen activator inhibitor 1 RNA-binding protein
MENAYGIGVTNRYALFLDEDAEDVDPLDILKQSEEEKLKNKKVAVAKDDKKGPVKKTDTAPKKTNDGDKENRNNRFGSTGSPEMTKLASSKRTSVEEPVKETGEPTRTTSTPPRKPSPTPA